MKTELKSETNKDLKDEIEYIVCCISGFAKTFNLKNHQAYPYLRRHGAIDYLLSHYEDLHTLPIEDIVNDLVSTCKRNGGGLDNGRL